MTQNERIQARSAYNATIAEKTLEELNAIATELVAEADELKKKASTATFPLTNKGQKAAFEAVKQFLNKQTINWDSAMGMVVIYDFFDKSETEITFPMLDTILNVLGSIQYTGIDEFRKITTVTEYFNCVVEPYKKVTEDIYVNADKYDAVCRLVEQKTAEAQVTEPLK